MHFGLCCLLYSHPLRYRHFTWAQLLRHKQQQGPTATQNKVRDVVFHNIATLQEILNYCSAHGIASYRMPSGLIPQFDRIRAQGILDDALLHACEEKLKLIKNPGLVLSMHPGQHVHLGSPREGVVEASLRDLDEHFWVARLTGCQEINIHLGGAYGDKDSALQRFVEQFHRIPQSMRPWITIENDERLYSVDDVISVANKLGLRATYDLHHERCFALLHKKTIAPQALFEKCRKTWSRYPYQRLHLSSPKWGYTNPKRCAPHADFIDPCDFPPWLLDYSDIHLDVEAKHKQIAISKLQEDIPVYSGPKHP